MPKVKAIFVRHSESIGNDGDLVKGTKDYKLNAKGERESKAIAPRIARFKPTIVLTSPLQRARVPAQRIARSAGVRLKVDKGLLPQDFGKFTGKPRETTEPKIRRLAMRTPGKKMPGGESTSGWLAKNDAAMSRVKKIIAKGGRPAVVTHSRNLTQLPHNFQGKKMQDPTKPPVEPGGYVTLEGKKKLVIHKGAPR